MARPAAPARRSRTRRRVVAGAIVTVLFAGVLLFGLFPTRTWWQQRKETSVATKELADLKAERARVARELERLTTDEEIARRAREDFGYVEPGQEAYNVLPAPTDPIGLPDGWPFTGVERVFGAD